MVVFFCLAQQTARKSMKKPGVRVLVMDAQMQSELGLGTYLGTFLVIKVKGGDDIETVRILLDCGKKIFGYECWWAEDDTLPKAPAFELVLHKDVRVFQPVGESRLGRTNEWLPAGEKIMVEKLEPKIYDHRDQVAVQFARDGRTVYLLATEVGFPHFYDHH